MRSGLFKFLIVCVCVFCAITAVLGITDRLTYEGITTASEMVSANVQLVESELGYLKIISACTDVYDPSVFQSFNLLPINSVENPDGTIYYPSNTYGVLVDYDLFDVSVENTELIVDQVVIDPSDVPKIRSMLFLLSHSSGTNLTIGFAVNMISFYASALFNIFFDSLPVIFSLLRAFLYLLGIG